MFGLGGNDVLNGGKGINFIDAGNGIDFVFTHGLVDNVVEVAQQWVVKGHDYDMADSAKFVIDETGLNSTSTVQLLNAIPTQTLTDLDVDTQRTIVPFLEGDVLADFLTHDRTDVSAVLREMDTSVAATSLWKLSWSEYETVLKEAGADLAYEVVKELNADQVNQTFQHLADNQFAADLLEHSVTNGAVQFAQDALSSVKTLAEDKANEVANLISEAGRVAILTDATKGNLEHIANNATGAVKSTAQSILNGLSGGGGGGASVICTELRRQGLMEDAIWEADERYGEMIRATDPNVYTGYYCWGQHVARWMKSSSTLTRIVQVFAKPWSEEMAYQMGAQETGSLRGKAIMAIGTPTCRWIGASLRPGTEPCSDVG